MRINRYISTAAILVSLTAISTACSDSDNWKPGPETNPGNMSVYFGEMTSYNIVVEPDDSRLIPVTIGRSNTDEAVTVPLIVTQCPEGAIVPQSVDFAPEQQAATIYIDLENMPSKSRGTISIDLPEDLTSPYGAGTTSLTFNVNISGAWIPVSEDVTLTTGDVYPAMTTKLYYLDGTNNFKLPDFFGSGIDLVFTMNTPGNGWTYITPIKNYVDAAIAYPEFGWGEYTYDGGWFLYDDAADEYPYWSPDGATYPEISLLEFENAYAYMQLISDDANSGYIYFAPYAYLGDGSGKYLTMNYSFTTTFTPYTTETE